jgi:hypothetical protein
MEVCWVRFRIFIFAPTMFGGRAILYIQYILYILYMMDNCTYCTWCTFSTYCTYSTVHIVWYQCVYSSEYLGFNSCRILRFDVICFWQWNKWETAIYVLAWPECIVHVTWDIVWTPLHPDCISPPPTCATSL